MKELIKIAIEGGYKNNVVNNFDAYTKETKKIYFKTFLLDPLFWQALFGEKAKEVAMTFFEMVMTPEVGFDKAVAYVKETTRGTALVN